MTTSATTATESDRDALAGKLAPMQQPGDQLEPLLKAEAEAQAAFDEAARVYESARQELTAASATVSRARARRASERQRIEDELRATASPKIEEFKQWAVRRHQDMTQGMPDPNRDREQHARQSDAARDAIHHLGDLALLEEAALDKRLAALRSEIGPGSR